MSDGDDQGAPDLSGWELLIEAAVDLAESYPEQYRVPIVKAILGTGRSIAGATGIPVPIQEPPDAEHGLDAAARAAGVGAEALQRIVRVTDGDQLELLARVQGSSTAERCRKAAVVYTFIKEKAFGQLDTDIEELRDVADRQGAYDSPNFTRHLRAKDLLLEIGKRGTSQKQYRLSRQGKEAAKGYIQELVGE